MGNREITSGSVVGTAVTLAVTAPAAQATTTKYFAKGSFDAIFSFTMPSASDLLSFAVSPAPTFYNTRCYPTHRIRPPPMLSRAAVC